MKTTSRQGAFTLVEMLVAIAVLSILLAVVFVPLRLAISSYHIGSARNTTQNAAQATLDQMERDWRRAAYVFPNTAIAGITDKAPYTDTAPKGNNGLPYVRSTDKTDIFTNTDRSKDVPQHGVCERGANSVAWGNTSRVDMILVKRNAAGVVLPIQTGDTVVTYYPRRLDVTQPYSPVDNPVVLFRAEFPYRGTIGGITPTGAVNVDTSPQRFPPATCTAKSAPDRNALWLSHNAYGEANLEPISNVDATITNSDGTTSVISGVHTLAIPRGIGLVGSQAYKVDPQTTPDIVASYDPKAPKNEAPLVPDTSFQLSDTNNDGKIDQVAASLALETFDVNQGSAVGSNGQPTGQIVRARRVFDLPNVR